VATTPALPFGHQLGLFRVPPLPRLLGRTDQYLHARRTARGPLRVAENEARAL